MEYVERLAENLGVGIDSVRQFYSEAWNNEGAHRGDLLNPLYHIGIFTVTASLPVFCSFLSDENKELIRYVASRILDGNKDC